MPGRIVVLPAVPSAELLEWTAGATLSFVGAPPKTINLRLTIPNKLFESLMAGVPVVVSGGPRWRRSSTCGRVGRRGRAVVGGGARGRRWRPRSATREAVQTARRLRARTAALERYNAETEQAGLVALYRRLAACPVTRVVLLLNNPFISDSRSWKLATSLTAAGCDVTVVARARRRACPIGRIATATES